MSNVANTRQIRFVRRTSSYWRVTFDNPPLNIFGPETIPELNEIVTALETDEDVKAVVFDSVVEGFFLTHYNFLAKLEDTTSLLPGPTGLSPLPEFMATSIALSAKNESQLSRRPGDNGRKAPRRACAESLTLRQLSIPARWSSRVGPTVSTDGIVHSCY